MCRIALANDNIPYIVTMNFGYSGGVKPSIFFHCANTGKKLEMLRQNKYVCFEMDIDHLLYKGKSSCDWGMRFTSIIGYGNITILKEIEEKKTGLNCIMKHYGGEGDYFYNEKVFEQTTVLKLQITEMTGKRK